MKRILTVATSEFLSLVRTKFFIIGILMMPVLVGASIAFQIFAARHVDKEDHSFAVIDHTGVLFNALAATADKHNKASGSGDARTGPYFVPVEVDPGGKSVDELRLDLSARVKKDELFAFIEIPASVVDIKGDKVEPIGYYTETPSYDALPQWIEAVLGDQISARRFEQASIDPALVAKLTRSTPLSTMGLVEKNADGSVRQAKHVDAVETKLLPFGLMYLLFLAIMTGAPQLLNAVIEEKMSKISEVLVASVTPFQLMMGKLIGMGSVSVVLALVYFFGAGYALFYAGRWELLEPRLLGWFLLFLIAAVMIYGLIFLAVGAASSDIKDAQGMMQSTMILVLLPLFASSVVLNAPNSGIAVGTSLFPTATPFLMLIRLAMKPGPPMWQVWLSIVLTFGTACAMVWAAGRIFRVGLLMQGKGGSFAEMIRWIRA